MKDDINKVYIRDGRAPIPKKALTSRVMSSNRAKNTGPELLLRKGLWNIGARGYRLHWEKVPGSPDITFPGKKVAIFVHGCFWHRCPHCHLSLPKSHSGFWQEKFAKNVMRDKEKIKLLRELNWKVLEMWECQIKKNLKKCISLVERALKNSEED
jgi:DNA mismatch endonuclease (patch repair protein)